MFLSDCTDVRNLVAGVLHCPDLSPAAASATALAFEALVDPLSPPPPWRAVPVTEPAAALQSAHEQVVRDMDRPRPVAELLALGEAARHLKEALVGAAVPAARTRR